MPVLQLTKLCSRCQEMLPTANFYKDRAKKDGLQPQCKSCWKRYKLSAAGRAANKRYYSSEIGRATCRRASEKYKQRHPDHVKARDVIHKLVVAGKLPGAKTLKCSRCSAQATDYHHHLGYSQEHWLDVIALCRRCHGVLG